MTRRRKAYPPRYQPRKPVFSAVSWAKWLSGQPGAAPNPDECTVPRTAIDEFRRRVVIGRKHEGSS